MTEEPVQLELDLAMDYGSLDKLVITAVVALDRPEVEYQVHYSPRNGRQMMDRVWLDAVWPIDRMSSKILAVLADHMAGVMWTKTEVQRVLNSFQRTYGCKEPF